MQAKRSAKCVALSNCDLCILNHFDLKMVMKDFPNSARQLEVRLERWTEPGLSCCVGNFRELFSGPPVLTSTFS